MPSEFVESLGDEYKNDPNLADIADAQSLAKSFINAQKLIGHDRIPQPQDSWGEGDWNEHYKRLGRPEDSKGYDPIDLKTIDDVPDTFQVDESQFDSFRELLHESGVSKKQGDAIIKGMTLSSLKQHKETMSSNEAQIAKSKQELQTEYGDKYQANMDIANEILAKFGGESLTDYLNETGLIANNDLIKAFVDIGQHFINDSGKGAGDAGLQFGGPANAQAEIQKLSGDAEFQKALGDRSHIGHKSALDRWRSLHAAAYPKAS